MQVAVDGRVWNPTGSNGIHDTNMMTPLKPTTTPEMVPQGSLCLFCIQEPPMVSIFFSLNFFQDVAGCYFCRRIFPKSSVREAFDLGSTFSGSSEARTEVAYLLVAAAGGWGGGGWTFCWRHAGTQWTQAAKSVQQLLFLLYWSIIII